MSPEEVQDILNVSRETFDVLQHYVRVLRTWQKSLNLVSAHSLAHVWRRHIVDCAQLYAHIPPDAHTLADMGSGAGLPGLILAILSRSRPNFHITLIESNSKKCGFLRYAAADLGLDVTILRARLQTARPAPVDVLTARALAPLNTLLFLAQPYRHSAQSRQTTRCLFLKGQDVEQELTATAKCWKLESTLFPSLSDPSGALLVIEDFHPC